jgi:hypothetical protein
LAKIGWATFWAIFSRTRLVTLLPTAAAQCDVFTQMNKEQESCRNKRQKIFCPNFMDQKERISPHSRAPHSNVDFQTADRRNVRKDIENVDVIDTLQ